IVVWASLLTEPVARLLTAVPRGEELQRETIAVHARVFEALSRPEHYGGPDWHWKAFCIAVQERDASPEQMAALTSLPAPAIPFSACGAKVTEFGSLKLPADHLLLRVRAAPEWRSGGLVTVRGEDYHADQAGAGYRLTLVRAWGRWRVVRKEMEWIS